MQRKAQQLVEVDDPHVACLDPGHLRGILRNSWIFGGVRKGHPSITSSEPESQGQL